MGVDGSYFKQTQPPLLEVQIGGLGLGVWGSVSGKPNPPISGPDGGRQFRGLGLYLRQTNALFSGFQGGLDQMGGLGLRKGSCANFGVFG